MKQSIDYTERVRIRKERSPQFYRDFVSRFPQSGMNVSQYCRKHQVSAQSFRKYQALLQAGSPLSKKSRSIPKLLPVSPPHMDSHPYPIELVLPSGTRIRCSNLEDSLVQALRPWLGETP